MTIVSGISSTVICRRSGSRPVRTGKPSAADPQLSLVKKRRRPHRAAPPAPPWRHAVIAPRHDVDRRDARDCEDRDGETGEHGSVDLAMSPTGFRPPPQYPCGRGHGMVNWSPRRTNR